MPSLLISNIDFSSEIIEISQEGQRQILGGGEETTVIFIGLKPAKLFPILSNWPVLVE